MTAHHAALEKNSLFDQSLMKRDGRLVYDLWLPMLLFGSMGAITWAIRGTSGWGGIDGTLVPGLAWGLIWCYLCFRHGVNDRGIVLWMGLGLALGGELGYGQYVSWIRGMFHTGDEIISISPWIGYAWFAVCGIGWAAPGGILLGWALGQKNAPRSWFARGIFMMLLLIIVFNIPLPFYGEGFISGLGDWFVRHCPELLFPHASLGIYSGTLDAHLSRTVYTNTQNMAVVVWWLAVLCFSILRRDRIAVVCGGALGLGFGIGFPISALWCLGYCYAPAYIDWWKMWELHSGFNLGITYALLLYWRLHCMENAEENTKKEHAPCATSLRSEGIRTLFVALSGFILIFAAGVEYFFWMGLAVALLFGLFMGASFFCRTECAAEIRQRTCFLYSIFLLLFILLHGGSSRAGVFLELYSAEAVDQYAWPTGRVVLFAPFFVLLFLGTLLVLVKQLRAPTSAALPPKRRAERMIDLFAFIGLIGALSIWPEKIGVLYALFLSFALFSFARINARFDIACDM